MIHYHGTPITPNKSLEALKGEHFCVSFFRPDNLKNCLRIGQSVMLDNGAFSAKTLRVPFNRDGFYEWLEPILGHPHWAVVPDVIDGSVEQQREMVKSWPFGKQFGIPVWHLGLSLDYLLELVDEWGKVCLGRTVLAGWISVLVSKDGRGIQPISAETLKTAVDAWIADVGTGVSGLAFV